MQPLSEWRADWPIFDGAILAGLPGPLLSQAHEKCKLAVNCSGSADPALCPVVSLNDLAVGAAGAEHLLNCRLEKFAFFGIKPDYGTSMKRLSGFKDALQGRGFACIECPVQQPSPHDWASHTNRAALIQWLRDLPKPIGIMAIDDFAAHDLAEACLQADISVPDRVAIVGVNNDDLLCESAWPPISSVEGDFSRVGYAAARILDRMLAGEELPAEDRVVRLPPLGVVQRQSTNMLAIKDPNLCDAVRFIREHACDPCTVHDVLRAIPVGRRWLERQFVAQLGRSPHDEIARIRIEAACRLLARPDISLMDIASRCGFAEIKSFYLAFRKVAQTTPAAYRRAAIVGSTTDH